MVQWGCGEVWQLNGQGYLACVQHTCFVLLTLPVHSKSAVCTRMHLAPGHARVQDNKCLRILLDTVYLLSSLSVVAACRKGLAVVLWQAYIRGM